MTTVTKEMILEIQGRIAKIEKARQELGKNIAVAEENCKTTIARLAELGLDVSEDTVPMLEDRAAEAERELNTMFTELSEAVTKAETVLAGVINV